MENAKDKMTVKTCFKVVDADFEKMNAKLKEELAIFLEQGYEIADQELIVHKQRIATRVGGVESFHDEMVVDAIVKLTKTPIFASSNITKPEGDSNGSC